jgi:sialate O-acetylesterase
MEFKNILLLSGLLISVQLMAGVKLPSIFADNMVLQQKSNVPLWGWADANKRIKISTSWDHQSYSSVADKSGRWKVVIRTPSAGGPYEIKIDDGKALTLTNILIGEVWLCSGQSNMEIPMKGYKNQPVLNSNNILAHANNAQLRLFHIERAVSNKPELDCKGSWQVSTPDAAATFSAVGFQFAGELQKILNVPVGIIESTWGGTPIEGWMSSESLSRFPYEKIPSASDTADRFKPTCLFNGMISPIAGFTIKGVLWYQGENNVRHPYDYADLMTSMIGSWRKLWANDTLSFYYVQIAPWKYAANRDSVALLREAQQKVQDEVPHTGMAVSIDVGNEFTIHPPDKTTISERLLYWALGETYGMKGIAYRSPYFKSMQKNGNVISISLSNAPNGFTSDHEEIIGFEIAGADHVFHPAKARIFKDVIQVQSDDVPDPLAVHYAFKDWVSPNLYNTEGLPVAPFRTDN